MRIGDWSSDVCSSDLFERADIGLRGEAQRMVRFLIFGRTDDAVMAAALVIVGLGEGTGIAEAEPVACCRDRKRATETVTVAAVEGREEIGRKWCRKRGGPNGEITGDDVPVKTNKKKRKKN